jgi:hypothetical protein
MRAGCLHSVMNCEKTARFVKIGLEYREDRWGSHSAGVALIEPYLLVGQAEHDMLIYLLCSSFASRTSLYKRAGTRL